MISLFNMQHQLVTIVSKKKYSLTPRDWLFIENFVIWNLCFFLLNIKLPQIMI